MTIKGTGSTPPRLDFAPLHDRMRWYVDRNILSCARTLVMAGTEVVDSGSFGYMDLETREPLRDDAIWRMYSSTKIVTSVAAMMLVEEGRLGLDHPLSRYLPAFADPVVLKPDAGTAEDLEPANGPILIRHLLSHSAGLSYGFIEPDSVVDRSYWKAGISILTNFDMSLEELTNRLAECPLAYQPGHGWRYSLATDVVARIIEVVSGLRFDQFLERRIFDPLGMVDTGFFVPEIDLDRLITMYAPTDLLDPMAPGLKTADHPNNSSYSKPRTLLSGGGGLVSTVADYLTFIRMIVGGGSVNGARLLRPDTLAAMRTNQLPPGIGVSFPMWHMPGTVFGLGFALNAETTDKDPPGCRDEYHWGGMAGTHTWMSPDRNLAGLCFTQRMPGFWHPFSHDFRRLAYTITASR